MQNRDYSFLRGKIIENCGTLANFAEKLGVSKQCLSDKLNKKGCFSQVQMEKTISILNLSEGDVLKCFFNASKVEKKSTD